ncbi:MAG TPA: isoamylase early set domain-containing protein [Chitinophagaceae bacterium]|nr:isoamylase early set domain-containing protein [Chitinophagaceae bacterium]
MVLKTYYKTKSYCKVKFSFKIENAETVEILGLNSDWQNSIIMSKRKDGSFSADVTLPKDSKHEFKYRVNETEWINEAEADGQQPNEFGGSNSVIVL